VFHDEGVGRVPQRLAGKRVLITQADTYMGPATAALFQQEGAEVLGDASDLTAPDAAQRVIARATSLSVKQFRLAGAG
jgi:2-keto-3-deoxy-L-fuconate dehydrogenase